MGKLRVALVACVLSLSFAEAQQTVALHVRIADVGAGLCCVIVIPPGPGEADPHYVVYDAGNFQDGGRSAFEDIEELIPRDSVIDLMVLSHSDADHLGAVPSICDGYTVARVIRSGFERTTNTWRRANQAIENEVELEHCVDINLAIAEYPMGATYKFGDAYVTMVCGFTEPWSVASPSRPRTGTSTTPASHGTRVAS